MSHLELFLLGPPRIERDGKVVPLRRRKAVALLAYLAVTGRRHSRDALATLFWPEHDQSGARAELRRALSTLKRGLGEGWLDVDRESAGIHPHADPSTGSGQALWLDVAEFQARLAARRAHDHLLDQMCPACFLLLAEATDLYRDDFLAGFTLRDSPGFDDWQFFQTEGLRHDLASALELLARGHSGRGEFAPAVAAARRWVALDPLHEPAQSCLMQAYTWSGQRAAALRQYAEWQRVLQEELSVPPDEGTAALYRAIKGKRQVPPPADRAVPLAARKHNLPRQATPFVGRETLLAGIARRLQDPACRLLTLVGPGGSGKTRLALKAAEATLADYAHGAFFIPLAALDSVEGLVPTVAEAVGFAFYEGVEPQRQLLDYLRGKAMLLIMDSFEHLLAGTGLVTEILSAAPQVKIVATSRARLNVEGEHRFQVGGMQFPHWEADLAPDRSRTDGQDQVRDAAGYGAVKLFLQDARRAQPGFELTGENLRDVVEVCRLVDGMPLGVRLAAAWVEMLSPAEIAAEIGRNLDFLATDLRDVPQRQRSMRATLDHSWRLLGDREREVFQGLSVFRGGFTRQAARHVAGASLRELKALVDRSLLHRAATGRYEVHELLRQYAAEKLDRAPAAGEAARDRHCAHYVAALQHWADDLKGPRQEAALAGMEAEVDNAQAAWRWAVEQGQVQRLDRAADGLFLFCEWRGRFLDGERLCRTAADRLARMAAGGGPAEGLRVRAKVLAWQSVFSRRLGRAEMARQALEQSLALLDEVELAGQDARAERAFALLRRGLTVYDSDHQAARQPYEQSLALYNALGDRWGMAEVLFFLSWVAWSSASFDLAKQQAQESLALRQSLGDRRGIAASLMVLGGVDMFQRRLEEAERLQRKSYALCRELDDRFGMARAGRVLASALVALGRLAEACALLEDTVAICSDLGARDRLATVTSELGRARMFLGQYEEARAHAQAGLTLARETGTPWVIAYALDQLGWLALVEGAYAEAHDLFQESLAISQDIGRRISVHAVLVNLAYAARGLGRLPQAGEYLSDALRMATEAGHFRPLVGALPAMALLLADRGEPERAVELYALACTLGAGYFGRVGDSRFWDDVAGRHIAAAAAALPPGGVAAAQARGRARDLQATVAELLAELGEG